MKRFWSAMRILTIWKAMWFETCEGIGIHWKNDIFKRTVPSQKKNSGNAPELLLNDKFQMRCGINSENSCRIMCLKKLVDRRTAQFFSKWLFGRIISTITFQKNECKQTLIKNVQEIIALNLDWKGWERLMKKGEENGFSWWFFIFILKFHDSHLLEDRLSRHHMSLYTDCFEGGAGKGW